MTTNKQYSKFIENDIFLIKNDLGLFCCACSLSPDMDSPGYIARNTNDMLEHLEEHKKANHRMPEDITESLLADDKENFGES